MDNRRDFAYDGESENNVAERDKYSEIQRNIRKVIRITKQRWAEEECK